MDALQGYAWLPAFWSRFSACAEHPGLGPAGKFVRDPDDALSSCVGRALRNRAQGENAGGDRENFYTELALEQTRKSRIKKSGLAGVQELQNEIAAF